MATTLAVLAAPALANQFPDLSGEYHGTELCDELDNGTPGVFVETSPIFIVQGKGGKFRLLFLFSNGKADVVYDGILKRVAGGSDTSRVWRLPAAAPSRARR